MVNKDGFCTFRAKPGVVVRYPENTESLTKEREHQKSIMQGCPEKWPPLQENQMNDFTFAFTHMSIKLRLHEAGHVDPISGTSFVLEKGKDENLDFVVANGHEYIVLDGSKVTEDECQLVSE
eukprot:6940082-Karenia_brevis.AAC.1